MNLFVGVAGANTMASTKKQVVMLAAGPFLDDGKLRESVANGAILVGIDGGAATLSEMEMTPDFVTGDFDSLTASERETLKKNGVKLVPTPDQNFTDLDKALVFVRETLDAKAVKIWGATGGRLDHTTSNLSALAKHGGEDFDVRLVDEWGETRKINGEIALTGGDLRGRTLSLIALGEVTDIWSEGVRWPLFGETLAPGIRDGTSNGIVGETVTIRFASGILLLMLHHARQTTP